MLMFVIHIISSISFAMIYPFQQNIDILPEIRATYNYEITVELPVYESEQLDSGVVYSFAYKPTTEEIIDLIPLDLTENDTVNISYISSGQIVDGLVELELLETKVNMDGNKVSIIYYLSNE